MALIKSVEAIKNLIPIPGENVYDMMAIRTPEKDIMSNFVCGIKVNSIENKIENVFRVSFYLFSLPTVSYLFIEDRDKDISTNTPFISVKNKDGNKPTINDWPFEVDDIGLHVKTGPIKGIYIYFATSQLDMKEVKNALKERAIKKTLVTETVYV